MMVDLKGRVVTAASQRPVHGAVVEVSSLGERPAFSPRRVTANRVGRFRFRIRTEAVDTGDGGATVLLRVLDEAGQSIGFAQPGVEQHDIVIEIAQPALERATLPRQPGQVSVVPPDMLDTIRAAARAAAPRQAAASLAAIDNVLASLPPLLALSDLVDVAHGVLRGRSDDFRAFEELLDDLEAWNHRAYPHVRRQLTHAEAESVLSPAFLKARVDAARARPRGSGESGISREAMFVTIVAAMRVARDDPRRIIRNIGVLLEQYCGLDPLVSLFRAAQLALAGGEIEQRLFLARLATYGGEGGMPPVPDGGQPGFPRFPPRPFPCPGGPPWPPDPGSGGQEPAPIDDCEPEITEEGRKALARRRTYTITGFSPQGACPGDTITITGTGLLFDGRSGIINFPGLERGSYVPSGPPESWTDTEIRVVVPEGVCNGFLDLEIPGGEDRIVACDREYELFVSVGAPVEFVGGETQILDFSADASPDECLPPGTTVRLFGHACNADRINLVVLRRAAEIIDDITFREAGVSRPWTYTVPGDLTENTSLTLRLEVSGPCGHDTAELRITVRRGVPIPGPDPYEPGRFENFLRNQVRDDILVATPRNLTELRKAIEVAEGAGARVGVVGGACSYTECVVPPATTNRLIDTDALNRTSHDDGHPTHPHRSRPPGIPEELWAVLTGALRRDLDDGHSVMSADVLASYREFTEVSPLRQRLVHVEAGIRFDRLVCLLAREDIGLTMPTLGGGKRHSVAGAISTGTHGSTTRLPPIADFVRAIHLVGTGGQQWWLEPGGSRRITDPRGMESLKALGRLDPCLHLRYDDDLFDAALVSFGTAGVFYSVVIETIDAHRFRVRTTQPSWREAQATLRERVIDTATPSDWFFDITTNPAGGVRLSTLEPVPADEPLVDDPAHHPLADELLRLLLGIPARLIPVLVFGWPLIVACRALRTLFRPRRMLREIRETWEMTRELLRFLRDLWGFTLPPYDTAEVARAIPNFLNLLWRLRVCMPLGRRIIDELQSLITEGQRPSGTWVRRDHMALTFEKDDCPEELPPAKPVTEESPFSRLFRSSEYAVPVTDAIAFANAILDVADRVREGPDAFVLAMNLRFTRATAALLGMQQFDRTCHAELFTINHLNGNAEFDRRLEPVLESFGAVPHWGQLHSARTDFATRFGTRGRDRLEAWRQAINELASGAETPNTFRNDFALRRRLLADL